MPMRIQLCHKHSRTGRSREYGRINGRSGSIQRDWTGDDAVVGGTVGGRDGGVDSRQMVSLNFLFVKTLAGGVKGLLDELRLEEVVVGVNPHPLLQHFEEQGISISVRVITEKLENE